MARLITTGFEVPNYRDPFTVDIARPENVSWSGTERSGIYSLRIIGTGGIAQIRALIGGTVDEAFFRIGFRTDGTADDQDHLLFNSDVTGTLFSIRTTGGFFALRVAGVDRVVGTIACVNNVWYLIEGHLKIADAGYVSLRINGVDQGDWSGDTKPGADTRIASWDLKRFSSATSNYYDDIAFNDTSGAVDNSWCDDGHIVPMRPDAPGDSTMWTPLVGANWEEVDEVTPDGDTTYVASDTPDDIDLYNLASPAGVPADAVIRRVFVRTIARKTDAGEDDKVQVGVKHGVTTVWSGDLGLSTVYANYYGPEYLVNPDTGNPWTVVELDSLQAGVKAT